MVVELCECELYEARESENTMKKVIEFIVAAFNTGRRETNNNYDISWR